jgi:hypothetical protein
MEALRRLFFVQMIVEVQRLTSMPKATRSEGDGASGYPLWENKDGLAKTVQTHSARGYAPAVVKPR